MTTKGGVTLDLFKWIIGTMIGTLGISFAFQQRQISALYERLDSYQNTVHPAISDIRSQVSSMSANITWITQILAEARVKNN